MENNVNQHLKIVFDKILPNIEELGINYWIIGGVAIAGLHGEFVRKKNDDVDIVVHEGDFERVSKLLLKLASECKLLFRPYPDEVHHGIIRKKADISENGQEIFSVVTVHKSENKFKFIFPGKGYLEIPEQDMEKTEKYLGKWKITIPTRNGIRKLFVYYMHYLLEIKKQGKYNMEKFVELRDKYMVDGKVIMERMEYEKFVNELNL